MSLVDLVTQYWGVGVVVIGGGIYFATHKKIAMNFAKSTIKSLMLAAEKGAEQLILENGPAKLEWVVEKGYAMMPPIVKPFISKDLFRVLVQSLFDEAKDLIEKNKDN
jgi:hypothetical protein